MKIDMRVLKELNLAYFIKVFNRNIVCFFW